MSGADEREHATLAIIAGGMGTRMGGPKHGLRIGGRPVLVDLLERCAWKGPTMLVVAKGSGNVEGEEFVSEVVEDSVAGEGPLRGVLSAIEAAAGEAVVVVPIDMPGLHGEHVRWVVSRGEKLGVRGVMLGRGGKIEPFPAWFRRGIAEAIRSRLACGERAMHGLADEPGVHVTEPPRSWGEQVWANLNEPGDLERWTNGR